jgi:anti-anti-sigma factor
VKLEQTQVGTVDVLSPVGALVDDDATTFNSQLKDRLRSPSTRLVVCLQHVPYLDSTALEGLLEAADDLGGRGSGLKLANVSPTCREIFELTGLSERFRLFATLEDAVKSFL